jgi:hypothetical protein
MAAKAAEEAIQMLQGALDSLEDEAEPPARVQPPPVPQLSADRAADARLVDQSSLNAFGENLA